MSSKTGEGVKEIFESLPTKIEAIRDEIARNSVANYNESLMHVHEDYTMPCISTCCRVP